MSEPTDALLAAQVEPTCPWCNHMHTPEVCPNVTCVCKSCVGFRAMMNEWRNSHESTLERRLAAPLPEEVREAIAYVRTRKMLHADEGDASVIDLLESLARQLAEAQRRLAEPVAEDVAKVCKQLTVIIRCLREEADYKVKMGITGMVGGVRRDGEIRIANETANDLERCRDVFERLSAQLAEAQEQARQYQSALKEALDSVANMERELGEARRWTGPVADGG